MVAGRNIAGLTILSKEVARASRNVEHGGLSITRDTWQPPASITLLLQADKNTGKFFRKGVDMTEMKRKEAIRDRSKSKMLTMCCRQTRKSLFSGSTKKDDGG